MIFLNHFGININNFLKLFKHFMFFPILQIFKTDHLNSKKSKLILKTQNLVNLSQEWTIELDNLFLNC